MLRFESYVFPNIDLCYPVKSNTCMRNKKLTKCTQFGDLTVTVISSMFDEY